MIEENPLVSVIMPVYNGEQYVEQALESVFKQDYQPFEVILVDDGSTDRTATIARSFEPRIRYCFQDNGGPSAARNRGLDAATGEFLAFLDSDDCWTPNNLSVLFNEFSQLPDLDLVMGKTQLNVYKSDKGKFEEIGSPFLKLLVGCILVKRSAARIIGRFDEDFIFTEDVDWFFRARDLNIRMKILEDHVSLHRRMHDANMTLHLNEKNDNYAKVLKRSLDRRRAMGGSTIKPALLFSSFLGKKS